MSEWQLHCERGAYLRLAFHGDRAAVHLHQLLHQCQTDAASLVAASPGSFDSSEAFEYMRQLAGRNSCSRILDNKVRLVPRSRERNSNLSIERGLQRVGERSEERHVGKECRSRWSPYH